MAERKTSFTRLQESRLIARCFTNLRPGLEDCRTLRCNSPAEQASLFMHMHMQSCTVQGYLPCVCLSPIFPRLLTLAQLRRKPRLRPEMPLACENFLGIKSSIPRFLILSVARCFRIRSCRDSKPDSDADSESCHRCESTR